MYDYNFCTFTERRRTQQHHPCVEGRCRGLGAGTRTSFPMKVATGIIVSWPRSEVLHQCNWLETGDVTTLGLLDSWYMTFPRFTTVNRSEVSSGHSHLEKSKARDMRGTWPKTDPPVVPYSS